MTGYIGDVSEQKPGVAATAPSWHEEVVLRLYQETEREKRLATTNRVTMEGIKQEGTKNKEGPRVQCQGM